MRFSVPFIAFYILLTAFTSSYGLNTAAATEAINFGSVAMDTPALMHRRLLPLTDYLKQTLQRPVNLKLSSNMAEAINEVSSGAVELAYLTPVAYIRAHERGNSQIVAIKKRVIRCL